MSHASRRALRLLTATALVLPAAPVWADGLFAELEPDTNWTLLRPTPRDQMRPLAVETVPFTLDAGHAQIEVDLVNAAWEGDGTMTDRQVDLFGFNARVGLTRNVDVQVQFVPYREQRTTGGATMSQTRGVGDTTFKLKLNLWGNDGGRTAAAVMPFVGVPTASGGVGSGGVEGGVVLPLSVALPGEVGGYLIGKAMFARNAGSDGVHPQTNVTVGVTRPVAGPVAAIEWSTTTDTEDGVVQDHCVNAVAIVMVGEDAEVDIGAAVNVPDTAAMINPYLRLTLRR